MSSPPSLEPLKIANPPTKILSQNNTPTSARPPSPELSPSSSHKDLPEGDQRVEDHDPLSIITEATPPSTPASVTLSPADPTTGASTPNRTVNGGPPAPLARPQPPANMASAPNIPTARPPPGRPTPGMMARGGMPMPMGMRGPMAMGGGPQMQTRLPPSLQAKMDKASGRAHHSDSIQSTKCDFAC